MVQMKMICNYSTCILCNFVPTFISGIVNLKNSGTRLPILFQVVNYSGAKTSTPHDIVNYSGVRLGRAEKVE